jgi:hypothetical protein
MTHKSPKKNPKATPQQKKLRKSDVNQSNSPRELNKVFPLTPLPKQKAAKAQQEAPKAQLQQQAP